MYIHTYQIDNVLNAYRKQLSQTVGIKGGRPTSASAPIPKDRVSLADQGQRQAIINQISAEIVDRIARNGPQNLFEDALEQSLEASAAVGSNLLRKKENEFTYTMIDENNLKKTNTLPIEGLSPFISQVSHQDQEAEEPTEIPTSLHKDEFFSPHLDTIKRQ